MRDREPRESTDLRLREDANGFSRADEPMPSDIAGLDRLLARTLAPHRSIDDARLARIVAASVEALPSPDTLPIRRWQPLRRARVAVAAAAVLVLAAGSVVTVRQALPERIGGTPIVLDSDAAGQPILPTPADPTRPGAAEATLIALLTDAQSTQSSWIDDRTFGGTDAARAVAPVLQIRGAGIEDLFAELGSIFGTIDS